MAVKKKAKPKKAKSMEDLTKNFDEFMKGKEINPNVEETFKKVLKKSTNKEN